jgi:chorismate mutase
MNSLSELIPLSDWHSGWSDNHLFIAGPCSAESRDQVLETGRQIAEIPQVKAFRAGIWKPRTRPGSFEGVGEEGLKWMQEVRAETGLLLATEVAYPAHVEKCLQHEIDILWIGARTTSNPFSVQEIASSLQGTNPIVLVKNPINPDMDMWIGAIERLYKAGIRRIGAIHRGFYPFEKTKLRNIPKWEIVIELKRIFPQLSILCDPSHISGSPAYIEDISQKALDLNYNGLMIESHINPIEAKSDAAQQVTPTWLAELFTRLVVRKEAADHPSLENHLQQFREQIDSIDHQLLDLLAQRNDIVRRIGQYKQQNNLSIFQLKRWENIITTRMNQGRNLDIPEEYLLKMLQIIHKMSIQIQAEENHPQDSTLF